MLAQFATKTRISAEDLAKERGAVLEEWRAGRDSRGRAFEAAWKARRSAAVPLCFRCGPAAVPLRFSCGSITTLLRFRCASATVPFAVLDSCSDAGRDSRGRAFVYRFASFRVSGYYQGSR